MTGLPRRLESVTCSPSAAWSLKSGALSPTFSIFFLLLTFFFAVFGDAGRMGSRGKSCQQPLQHVIDDLRIGAAARSFHDLPDKRFEYAFIAGTILGHVGRILFHDFAAHPLDLPRVLNLRQTLRGDDLFGRLAGPKHLGDNLFARSAGDVPGFDLCEQTGQSRRGDWALFDGPAGIVQSA